MTVYLRPDQIRRLKQVGERRGESMSAVLRRAIDRALAERERFAELAALGADDEAFGGSTP
jgi:cytidylate kinase